jgi:hypothetical protein
MSVVVEGTWYMLESPSMEISEDAWVISIMHGPVTNVFGLHLSPLWTLPLGDEP